METRYFDIIDSTNLEAKRQYRAGTADFGTLFVAGEQTAGRGRLGRSFYSPASGIYFSLLIPPHDAEVVTVRAAIATCRAVEKLVEKDCKIKWINDIYHKGKKIAGILAEGILIENELKAQVLGIGINLKGEDFPMAMRGRAGSLDTDIDGVALAEETMKTFMELIEANPSSLSAAELNEYKERQFILGKEIEIYMHPVGGQGVGLDEQGREIRGIKAVAMDIDESGRLVVSHDGITEALSSAEISVKI